jgi:hypothetical protein
MTTEQEKKELAKPTKEQIVYADILFYGSWLGIFIMVITYFLYLGGVVEPYIPISKMPDYWSMPSDQFAHAADVPLGWGWVGLLGTGDFINFLGIALLGALTIIGYLVLIRAYLRLKDTPFMLITIVEVLVLVLAASGILGSGGH